MNINRAIQYNKKKTNGIENAYLCPMSSYTWPIVAIEMPIPVAIVIPYRPIIVPLESGFIRFCNKVYNSAKLAPLNASAAMNGI